MPFTPTPADPNPKTPAERESCAVCKHKDRDFIDAMLAQGAFLLDLQEEYGIRLKTLRKHESLHSTTQPSIDPLSFLRHIRWLNEEQYHLTYKAIYHRGTKKITPENFGMRCQAIMNSLKIIETMVKMTGAKNFLDPYVVLPRWEKIMRELADGLEPYPEAKAALRKIIKDYGPKRTGTPRPFQLESKHIKRDHRDGGDRPASPFATTANPDKQGEKILDELADFRPEPLPEQG
jgi:hypothetical protein